MKRWDYQIGKEKITAYAETQERAEEMILNNMKSHTKKDLIFINSKKI